MALHVAVAVMGASAAAGCNGALAGQSASSDSGAEATSSNSNSSSSSSGGASASGGPAQSPPAPCSSLSLPNFCEACSNGETVCAHYVIQNGACRVETCPTGTVGISEGGAAQDGAPQDGAPQDSAGTDAGTFDASEGAAPGDAAGTDAGNALVRVTGTCAEAEQGILHPTTVAEFDSILIGRWQLCPSNGGSGGLSGAPDEMGIEFTSDGNWYALTQVDGGPLARSQAGALTEQGTWTAMLDTGSLVPNQFQLTVNRTGGFIPTLPTFSATPTKLLTGSMAGSDVYVAIP